VAKTKRVPEEGNKTQKLNVRICVDLTKLNESVQIEKYDLLSIILVLLLKTTLLDHLST